MGTIDHDIYICDPFLKKSTWNRTKSHRPGSKWEGRKKLSVDNQIQTGGDPDKVIHFFNNWDSNNSYFVNVDSWMNHLQQLKLEHVGHFAQQYIGKKNDFEDWTPNLDTWSNLFQHISKLKNDHNTIWKYNSNLYPIGLTMEPFVTHPYVHLKPNKKGKWGRDAWNLLGKLILPYLSQMSFHRWKRQDHGFDYEMRLNVVEELHQKIDHSKWSNIK